MSGRVYLDWNATAPLRPEARAAMLAAMDLVGNPSSVHAEGRAAKALVERARGQIAAAFGAEGADIVFTSGATEAAALACAGRGLRGAAIEHDAVAAWVTDDLPVDAEGRVTVTDPAGSALQLANSETGVVQALPAGLAVSDATQAFGKLPVAFNWLGATAALISGAQVRRAEGDRRADPAARHRSAGDAEGRRAGDGPPRRHREPDRHRRHGGGGRGGGAAIWRTGCGTAWRHGAMGSRRGLRMRFPGLSLSASTARDCPIPPAC